MERISRALELARAQREADSEAVLAEPESVAVGSVPPKSVPLKATPSKSTPSRVDGVEHLRSDAATSGSMPSVTLSADRLDKEHIVSPGCPGERGAPYKMLRTQVLKRLEQLGANTLAVLSAGSGAGKTLTAINLAIAVAADKGRTALLVDFDLRNPSIHRRLGYEPAVGVEDCLSDNRPVQEAMFRIDRYDRLTVLPARSRVDYSSELLRSQRAVDLMIEMRTRYADRVLIFDLPPVLQADDALAFSRLVQAGLVVVGEGKSLRDDTARCIGLLHELPIVGTVLNGSRDGGRYHY